MSTAARERGAVTVETGLIATVLLAFVLGIVDMSVVMFHRHQLNHAAEETGRRVAVDDLGADLGCPLGGGMPDEAKRIACQVKDRAGLPPADLRVRLEFVDLDGGPSAANADDVVVRICVMGRSSSVSGLLGPAMNQLVHRSTVEVALEGTLSMPNAAATEPPLPGEGWGFCA